jgi:hypothetical protein
VPVDPDTAHTIPLERVDGSEDPSFDTPTSFPAPSKYEDPFDPTKPCINNPAHDTKFERFERTLIQKLAGAQATEGTDDDLFPNLPSEIPVLEKELSELRQQPFDKRLVGPLPLRLRSPSDHRVQAKTSSSICCRACKKSLGRTRHGLLRAGPEPVGFHRPVSSTKTSHHPVDSLCLTTLFCLVTYYGTAAMTIPKCTLARRLPHALVTERMMTLMTVSKKSRTQV